LRTYLKTHDDRLPDDLQELAPLVGTRLPDGLLDRYTLLAHGRVADLPPRQRDRLVELNAPIDLERDVIWQIGNNAWSSRDASQPVVENAIQAFMKINGGVRPATPEQVQPYLSRPVSAEKIRQYLEVRR
jgi:hypothetical protein